MKYKVGDKVKIIKVGDVTDPTANDWIGEVSKVKEGIPKYSSVDYMLESGFPAYEGELELVPEFKVGDIVVIAHAEGNDSSLRPNDTGVVLRIAEYETEHPYEVKFLDGEAILYMGKELELALPKPVDTEKPKATTTFALLGKDGYYYDAEFVNVGYELFRSYQFPAENITDGRVKQASIIRIDNPRWLYVAPSGSHRIIDKHGRSHYIPCGWKHLWWKVEEGKPEPVK